MPAAGFQPALDFGHFHKPEQRGWSAWGGLPTRPNVIRPSRPKVQPSPKSQAGAKRPAKA